MKRDKGNSRAVKPILTQTSFLHVSQCPAPMDYGKDSRTGNMGMLRGKGNKGEGVHGTPHTKPQKMEGDGTDLRALQMTFKCNTTTTSGIKIVWRHWKHLELMALTTL